MATPTQFIMEVREEMNRVIWPQRPEVVKLTGQVIVVSLFCAAFIGISDYIFTYMTELFI